MDQKPSSARAQLAEALAFVFRERQLNNHEVGRRCQVSSQDVARWLDGSLVPAPKPWGDLRSRWSTFAQYHQLWERARAEERETRELVASSLQNGHRAAHPAAPIGTNLGNLIQAALPDPPPTPPTAFKAPSRPSAREDIGLPPTTERDRGGRVMLPPRPEGSNTAEARKLREDFVRNMLRQRPTARATGNDSVLTAVRQTFGVGITPAFIEAIRREVVAEQMRAHPPAQAPAAPAPLVHTAPAVPIAASAPLEVSESDVAAGVEMIAAAIPGLRQLLIEVDETGQATYTYEVRTVRTGRGTVQR